MKKLIAALALCVGTVAFANETPDKAQKATQVFTQQPGDSIQEARQNAEEGIDATEVGPAIGRAAKEATGLQTESEGTFKVAQSFNLRGTLKDKTMEGVTIERPGLPAADLDVRDKTAVWLDGKKIKDVKAIPEGAQVRAKFQLEGQDIVAVELRATSTVNKAKLKKTPAAKPMDTGATGGSGTPRDDARDMENEVKDEASEVESDLNKSLK